MDEFYCRPNNEFKTEYIMTLNRLEQNKIRAALIKKGLSDHDVKRGMAGRVCDLEDTIPVYKILSNSRHGRCR